LHSSGSAVLLFGHHFLVFFSSAAVFLHSSASAVLLFGRLSVVVVVFFSSFVLHLLVLLDCCILEFDINDFGISSGSCQSNPAVYYST
jgi:hypothetical protein